MPVRTSTQTTLTNNEFDCQSDSTNSTTSLPDTIRYPTTEYSRDEFYETMENVRYAVKITLSNGAQAENVPVGIEDLIEFIGDVELHLQQTPLTINYKNHSHWTAKLQTEQTLLTDVPHRSIEASIESIAETHGLALRKQISMSGRGYDSQGHRIVLINYSFGTYRDDTDYWIQCPDNPTTRYEWVGGKLGCKEQLNPSQIEVKSVTTKTPRNNARLFLRKLLPTTISKYLK